jgi:hypothetical protein
MNRRPLNSLPLGKAITGFVNYKTAGGLSDRSVDSYKRILEHWEELAGNKNVAQFTDHDTNSYLSYSSFIVQAARSIPASTGQAGAPLQQID